MESIYRTKSPAETIKLGQKLGERLKPGQTVLLYGDLGAGKTHFIKGIAKGLGIRETIKSPTYVYVSRYAIKSENQKSKLEIEKKSQITNHKSQFFHYDLYRFEKGGDLASIGFEETIEDPRAINVVEWADRVAERVVERMVERVVVRIVEEGDSRSITIQFISPAIVPEEMVQPLYNEWITPMNVRAHCEQVTRMAMRLAEAYVRKGEIIKMESLYTACMLHDLNRVCDFKTMERSHFKEEVTEEKWAKWTACREQFKGMRHEDITAQILQERGFTETAELVRAHNATGIVLEPEAYDTLEKKILYYADKRVKHAEIVSLAERFRDGRQRHGQADTPEEKKLYQETEKKAKALEKKLFRGLDIEPEEII